MGGYYDYRSYFEDISNELSTLRTEIKDINDQWIERNTEQYKDIYDYFTFLVGIIVACTVTSLFFK